MIKSAIEKILELDKIETIKHEGLLYANKELHLIDFDESPQPLVLNIHTLSGIIDYISIHPDNAKEYLIHIMTSQSIYLYGEYEKIYGRRKVYLQSECIQKKDFSVISKFDQIEFITALQVNFILDESLKDLIDIVSNITDEQSNNFIDNGISQNVIIKKGIKREAKEIINPIILRPYRTFEEIEQPESNFIFKIIKHDNKIEFKLKEVESNHWKVTAINLIKKYLRNNISSDKIDKIPINIIC